MQPKRWAGVLGMMALLLAGTGQAPDERPSDQPAVPDLSEYDRDTLQVLCEQLYRRVADLEERLRAAEDQISDLQRGPLPTSAVAEVQPESRPLSFEAQGQARKRELMRNISKERANTASSGPGKDNYIQSMLDEIKTIDRGKWVPPLDWNQLGATGALSDAFFHPQFKVFQVIDGHNVIMHVFRYVVEEATGYTVRETGYLWIQGIDTSAYTDGAMVNIPGLFIITGNRTYATSGGSTNTVFVAEPYPGAEPDGATQEEKIAADSGAEAGAGGRTPSR